MKRLASSSLAYHVTPDYVDAAIEQLVIDGITRYQLVRGRGDQLAVLYAHSLPSSSMGARI